MALVFTASLLLLTILVPLCEGSCCPNFFMRKGDWCYHYNSAKKDWNQANLACKALGAELVSIHGADESNEIYGLWQSLLDEGKADDGDFSYWIGLHDLQYEGYYQWSDGTEVNYVLWQSGEPNNNGNEDCVAPRNHGSNAERQFWNDYDCSEKKPYFCRFPISS
nr:C-type lectin lectoxin-Thr1-like [Lytechinus pictus]